MTQAIITKPDTAAANPGAADSAGCSEAVYAIGLDPGNRDFKVGLATRRGLQVKAFPAAAALAQTLERGDASGLTAGVRAAKFSYPAGSQPYFLGDDSRYGLMPGWLPTDDERLLSAAMLRLVLYAVTVQFGVKAALNRPAPRVHLTVGLPLHLLNLDYGARVQQAWAGLHQVEINSRAYHVEIIGVDTMSQPHGSLTNHYFLPGGQLNLAIKPGEAVGVIDMGYGTTDVARLVLDPRKRKMVLDEAHTIGLSHLGAQNLYRAAHKRLYRELKRDLDSEQLEQAVHTRRLESRGQAIDIDDIVSSAANQVAEQLAADLITKAGWSREVIEQTPVILGVGGAPLLLGDAFKQRLAYAHIPATARTFTAAGLTIAALKAAQKAGFELA